MSQSASIAMIFPDRAESPKDVGLWMGVLALLVLVSFGPAMQGGFIWDDPRHVTENLALRSAEVTEAWQERGQDFVTVHFLASLLDYTVDECSGQVVEGSRTEPVKFEEFWTFVRPVGPNAWRLSAIQQG